MIACVQRLSNALDTTGYKFAHFLWSHAPSGDWGVYSEDGAETFFADGRNASSRLTGSVDYYTRSDAEEVKTKIETALKTSGLAWWLESIQYENDTRFIHYEWRWHE